MYAAIGRHPNCGARASTTPTSPSSRRWPRTSKCVAIGETGLDFYRDGAPRADQERAFAAQIELARETGKPLVIHTRAAEDDTLAHARGAKPRACSVIMHCFSMTERLDGVPAHERLVDLVRGQRHVPQGPATCATAALRVPARAAAGRDRRALSCRRSPCGASRNQPANVVATAQALAVERAGAGRTSSTRHVERSAAARVRMVRSSARCALRRAPDRELGQNFLVDSQHPRRDRAGWRSWTRRRGARDRWRARECCPSGWPRAPRTCTWWSSTRGLRHGAARGARRRSSNVTLHFADALEIDLAALAPAPNKVVANLPYGDRRHRDPAHDRRAARASSSGW